MTRPVIDTFSGVVKVDLTDAAALKPLVVEVRMRCGQLFARLSTPLFARSEKRCRVSSVVASWGLKQCVCVFGRRSRRLASWYARCAIMLLVSLICIEVCGTGAFRSILPPR